ncbi:thioredoxin [Hydrogenimonas sp.]|nr:thioredoxin [Hydrogenimonas sp.]
MQISDLKRRIENSPAIMLYFEGEQCNVCRALKPKLFEAFDKNFPKIEKVAVDVGGNSEVAAQFGVFSIPTAIIFLDSKEFARVGRNVSIAALVEQIKRPYEMMFS